MHRINTKALDLNLLVVLEALLSEHSVTRASEKLDLSQSATSHALGRLRKFFQDPLLVRTPKGMVPTRRAEELIDPLDDILLKLEQMIQPILFNPTTAKGTIRVASTDYASVVILPVVLKH